MYSTAKAPVAIFRRSLLGISLALLPALAACGNDGPGATAEQALRLVSEGEVTEAADMFTLNGDGAALLALFDGNMPALLTAVAVESGYEERIDDFRIVTDEGGSTSATINFHVRLENGDGWDDMVSMRKVDGQWKVVLDDEGFSGNGSRNKAYVAAQKNDLRNFAVQQEVFFDQAGRYATDAPRPAWS